MELVNVSVTEWKCDATITIGNEVGSITSPLYPAAYPLFTDCHIILEAPEAFRVVLELVHFDLRIAVSVPRMDSTPAMALHHFRSGFSSWDSLCFELAPVPPDHAGRFACFCGIHGVAKVRKSNPASGFPRWRCKG